MKRTFLLITVMVLFAMTSQAASRLTSVTITHVESSSNARFDITYNSKNRVESVVVYVNGAVTQNWSFTYNLPEQIVVNKNIYDYYGTYQEVETYTFEDGHLTTLTKYLGADEITIVKNYQYENGHIVSRIVKEESPWDNDDVEEPSTYTWTDGNMTGISSVYTEDGIEYHQNTSLSYSDIEANVTSRYLIESLDFSYAAFLLGLYTPSKNLRSKVEETKLELYYDGTGEIRSETVTYDYVVDSYGNVTKVTANSTSWWAPGNASGPTGSIEPYSPYTYVYEFSWEDDPTGVADVKAEDRGKDSYYSLSGQRLQKPRKGLNIIGGRKVVVK